MTEQRNETALVLREAIENSRRSLDKIGDGDWTPQDYVHTVLLRAAEETLAALHDEVKNLRKERAALRREVRYWRSLTHVSLGGERV